MLIIVNVQKYAMKEKLTLDLKIVLLLKYIKPVGPTMFPPQPKEKAKISYYF